MKKDKEEKMRRTKETDKKLKKIVLEEFKRKGTNETINRDVWVNISYYSELDGYERYYPVIEDLLK